MTSTKTRMQSRRVGRWLCVAVLALTMGAFAGPAYAGGSQFSFSFGFPVAPYGYGYPNSGAGYFYGSYGSPAYGGYGYPGYAPYPVYVAPAPVWVPAYRGYRCPPHARAYAPYSRGHYYRGY